MPYKNPLTSPLSQMPADTFSGNLGNANVSPHSNPEEEDKDLNIITDTIHGIGAGVAGAVEGLVELPTIFAPLEKAMFGTEYLDYAEAVPENLGLGHARSIPGSLAQGITHFLAGLWPIS